MIHFLSEIWKQKKTSDEAVWFFSWFLVKFHRDRKHDRYPPKGIFLAFRKGNGTPYIQEIQIFFIFTPAWGKNPF